MDKYNGLDSSSSEVTQGEPRTNQHTGDSEGKGEWIGLNYLSVNPKRA